MLKVCNNAQAQVEELTAVIEESLRDAIAEKGRGCIAVSGGSSPKPLYKKLSESELDWTRIDIVMVDDRFVPLGHAASNETMIREHLLVGNAAQAKFWTLYAEGELAEVAQRRASEWQGLTTPDVAVMGMGSDGHTASWFPGAQGLDEALSLNAPIVVPVVAKKSEVTGDYLERLTVSYAFLKDCPVRVLMMAGDEKKAVYDEACADGAVNDMPIRMIIRDAHSVTAYWTE